MIARRAPRLRSSGRHGALHRAWGTLASVDLNPLHLQGGRALLVPAALLVLGHLTITRQVTLPLLLPAGAVDWLQELIHADVVFLREKLTGLLLLAMGTLLFCLLARPVLMPPLPVALPTFLATPRTRAGLRRSALLLFVGVVVAAFGILQIAQLSYSTLTVAMWLAGVGVVGAALLWRDRLSGIDLRPRVTRFDVALIVALTGFAGLLLFYRLGSVPDSLWPDEGSFFFMSRDIATGAWKPRIFEAGTYTFPVLANFYQAAVFKLFGASLETWRAASVIAVLAAVPALYLLGRHVIGRPLAVAAVVLFITSPHLIAFSRLGYNNAQAIAPVVVSLYLLYVAADRRSAFLLFLAAATAGLGFYTYPAARLAIVVIVLLLGAGVLTRWLTSRLALSAGAIVVLVVALVVLPMNLYLRATLPEALTNKLVEGLYFDHFYGLSEFPEEDLVGPIPNKVVGTPQFTLFFAPDIHARLISRGAVRTALAYDDAQIVDKHYIPGSLGGPLGSIALLAGFAAAVAALRRSPGSLMLVVWAFAGVTVLSTLSSFPPQWTRLVPVIPVVALLSSLGIAALLRPITGPWSRRVQAIVFFAVVTTVAVAGLRDYFAGAPKLYPPSLPDVIGFAVRDPAAPARLVAVYEEDERLVDPPVSLRVLAPEAEYMPVPRSQVRTAVSTLEEEGGDFWLFFDPASEERALDAALDTFGAGDVRYYYDAEGRLIGGSYRRPPR